MRRIKIGFSTRKKALLSKIIRKIEGTPFSHTYIELFPKSIDIPMIYQASSTMIHFQASSNFDAVNTRIYEKELEITDDVYQEILRYCMLNAAKPYSVLQLFAILTQKVGQVFGITIKNWADNGEAAQICSELTYNILKILGYKIDKNVDLITPKDVYNIVNTMF
jgi:hypothetical protein